MLFDVRRFAALDMHGSTGAVGRRHIIRIEFVAGAIGCVALGTAGLFVGGGWIAVLGLWLITIGINYVPLAVTATALLSPGALETELMGANLRKELGRAGLQQLWILVPFAVVLAAMTP